MPPRLLETLSPERNFVMRKLPRKLPRVYLGYSLYEGYSFQEWESCGAKPVVVRDLIAAFEALRVRMTEDVSEAAE
jgi:hypothetical protein